MLRYAGCRTYIATMQEKYNAYSRSTAQPRDDADCHHRDWPWRPTLPLRTAAGFAGANDFLANVNCTFGNRVICYVLLPG